jgi:hypothetical protein
VKYNYLYRSWQSTKRYLLFAFTLPVAGSAFFVGLAIGLSALGLSRERVMVIDLVATVFFALYFAYSIHRHDFVLLRSRIWPMDTLQDGRERLVKLLRRTDRVVAELAQLRRKTDALIVDSLRMQSKAKAIRSMDLLSGVMRVHGDILAVRADIVEHSRAAEQVHHDLQSYLQRLDQIDDVRAGYRQIGALSEQVSLMRSSIPDLRRRQESITLQQTGLDQKLGVA